VKDTSARLHQPVSQSATSGCAGLWCALDET
jgi:hypothetical protein